VSDPFLKVEDVAEMVGMRRESIRQSIAEGELPAYKFGQCYRIKPEDAEMWIESHRVTCAAGGLAVPSSGGSPRQNGQREMAR
jgi:excisionase family DNA binding protein